MKTRNLNFILGFVIALCYGIVAGYQAYTYISISINEMEYLLYLNEYGQIANLIIGAIAYLALAIFAVLFIVYNFIRRNPEVAYRGALIGLGSHSIIAGALQIINVLTNIKSGSSASIDTRLLINGILVILTGVGLIYAAVTKYAAKGRSIALTTSMVLSVLYVVNFSMDIAKTHTFAVVDGMSILLLIAFILMSLLAYNRRTYVTYY